MECALVVNAAGASSAKLAEMLGVPAASKDTVAEIAVPVEPRKRSVCGPHLSVPLLRSYGFYSERCVLLKLRVRGPLS